MKQGSASQYPQWNCPCDGSCVEHYHTWRTQCLWLRTSTSLALQQPTSAGNLGQAFNRLLKIISTVSLPQCSSTHGWMSASLVAIQNDCFSFSFKRIFCFLGVTFFLKSFREWRREMPDSGGIRMATYLDTQETLSLATSFRSLKSSHKLITHNQSNIWFVFFLSFVLHLITDHDFLQYLGFLNIFLSNAA